MFIVTALSLFLLIYVGYGEARRTYEKFHLEKLTAQGRVVQNAMEGYLRAGLPLRQYVGFTTLAGPIVESEDIDALIVYDQKGRQIFQVRDRSNPTLPPPSPGILRVTDKTELAADDTHYQVILPLRTRFEAVGSVVVVSSVALVDKRLHASFAPLVLLALGFALAFGSFVYLTEHRLARLRVPWLQIAYGVTFLAMAGVLVSTLIGIYSDGVQGKAKSAAATLSQRLNDLVQFNLRISDFDGLDKTFAEFRRLNPEISEAALIVDGLIQIDTEAHKVGTAWTSDPRAYEFIIDLSKPGQLRRVAVAVAMPVDLVYRQVEGSLKSFAALFIASALFAGLFLQVAAAMQRLSHRSAHSGLDPGLSLHEESALNIIKPIFFVAVFIENLTYSFLPSFMRDIGTASGTSLSIVSLPFTAYYLCFALSLVPAGYLSERYGAKALVWVGLLISSLSMLCLMLPIGILTATVIRATAGIGQGMIFIGIQAYILAVTSHAKRTQGAGIIVFGFQGGMIAGMAIGSLLATYIHVSGVFAISGGIGLAAAVYSILIIPTPEAQLRSDQRIGVVFRRIGLEMVNLFRSAEFLKTIFLIGIPAKAIMTGVVIFALPLLLGARGFRQEEIGQVIMLYGIGVVAANGYASRIVDRTGRTGMILFLGSALSGIGLVMIGMMDVDFAGNKSLGTALLVGGVVIVGLAHGFINAPVVTHVAHSKLAGEIGANSAAASYRFLERAGHAAGPFLLSQFFIFWGQSAEVLAWIGAATVVCGLLFIARLSPPPMGPAGLKTAS